MKHIHVTLREATVGASIPSAKRLVVWEWRGEVVYANVSIQLPPGDDFDTFSDRVVSKLGAGREFYADKRILYAESIQADGLSDKAAHKAAADILIADLAPRGATRKAKRPADVTLHIEGEWPAGVPTVFGPDGASGGTDPQADFVATYLGGTEPEPVLAKLIDEHVTSGETFLMHPSTFEIELGGEPSTGDIAWFGFAADGGRIGLDGAAVVFQDSEGGQRVVADSLQQAILTWCEADSPERLAAAQAWLGQIAQVGRFGAPG